MEGRQIYWQCSMWKRSVRSEGCRCFSVWLCQHSAASFSILLDGEHLGKHKAYVRSELSWRLFSSWNKLKQVPTKTRLRSSRGGIEKAGINPPSTGDNRLDQIFKLKKWRKLYNCNSYLVDFVSKGISYLTVYREVNSKECFADPAQPAIPIFPFHYFSTQEEQIVLNFRSVRGWGKIPLSSRANASHSWAASVLKFQKTQPCVWLSNVESWASM